MLRFSKDNLCLWAETCETMSPKKLGSVSFRGLNSGMSRWGLSSCLTNVDNFQNVEFNGNRGLFQSNLRSFVFSSNGGEKILLMEERR